MKSLFWSCAVIAVLSVAAVWMYWDKEEYHEGEYVEYSYYDTSWDHSFGHKKLNVPLDTKEDREWAAGVIRNLKGIQRCNYCIPSSSWTTIRFVSGGRKAEVGLAMAYYGGRNISGFSDEEWKDVQYLAGIIRESVEFICRKSGVEKKDLMPQKEPVVPLESSPREY